MTSSAMMLMRKWLKNRGDLKIMERSIDVLVQDGISYRRRKAFGGSSARRTYPAIY